MARRPYLWLRRSDAREHGMGVLSKSEKARARVERDPGGPGLFDDARAWRSERVADLAAGIAHEVRNPLNAMAIHLEVLSDKLRNEEGALPAAVRPNLEAIRSQIHRLDDIIRKFSDFAQGRAQSKAIAPIVEDAVTLCSFPLRRRGLEVELSALPEAKVADGAALALALVDVLLLAVDAVEVGTRIGIDVRRENETIRMCLRADGPNVRMDAKRLENIDALLRAQGGRLEPGFGDGILAMFLIPEETAASPL